MQRKQREKKTYYKRSQPRPCAHPIWAELGKLTKAELRLVTECGSGKVIDLAPADPQQTSAPSADAERVGPSPPDAPSGENRIRARLLRHIIMRGCARATPHEKGVQIKCAWIEEELDLHGCLLPNDLSLNACRIESGVDLRFAKGETIMLDASHLGNGAGAALRADRITFSGGVSLRNDFRADGEVSLIGAKIGGNLECNKGKFTTSGDGSDRAISADGLTVGGDVLLGDDFEARGGVRLGGAVIEGRLDCTDGAFIGRWDGKKGRHGGALIADEISIGGTLLIKGDARFEGRLNLSLGKAAAISDEIKCWPVGNVVLDGFSYRRFADSAPTDSKSRIDWLEKQIERHLDSDFYPQPWEQLAQVLRESGHGADARRVHVKKEMLQRRVRSKRDTKDLDALKASLGIKNVNKLQWCDRYSYWKYFKKKMRISRDKMWDKFFGRLLGYGYEPLRAFGASGIAVGIGVVVYALAFQAGAMAPSATPALLSNEWHMCAQKPNPAKCWEDSVPGGDYETFNSILYSLDTFIPVVSLGQDVAWAPTLGREDWISYLGGVAAWVFRWGQIAFGWIVSALLLTTVAALIKRD